MYLFRFYEIACRGKDFIMRPFEELRIINEDNIVSLNGIYIPCDSSINYNINEMMGGELNNILSLIKDFDELKNADISEFNIRVYLYFMSDKNHGSTVVYYHKNGETIPLLYKGTDWFNINDPELCYPFGNLCDILDAMKLGITNSNEYYDSIREEGEPKSYQIIDGELHPCW